MSDPTAKSRRHGPVRWAINCLWILFVRGLLWLRYRISLRGAGAIRPRGEKGRGTLFLANHPALIDPVMLLTRLYPKFHIRPLAEREQIVGPVIRQCAGLLGVIPLDSIASGGTTRGVRETMGEVISALEEGENILLYPAGRLMRSAHESFGANSGVERILAELPDVRIVLVRTRGLWGSRLGRASGEQPSMMQTLLRGVGAMALSLILFLRRRRVEIDLVEPDDFPRDADRAGINRYLEAHYNAVEASRLHIPMTLWDRRGVRELPEPAAPESTADVRTVPIAVRESVLAMLREMTGEKTFDNQTTLADDLGLDSLQMMELIERVTAEIGEVTAEVETIRTVGDVLLAASGAMLASSQRIPAAPEAWFSRNVTPWWPVELTERNLCESLLVQARRLGDEPIFADGAKAQTRTWREMILGIELLRHPIAKLSGEAVGVLLPACGAATTVYYATLFAGKIPAMINWTVGRKNLEHCVDLIGLKTILTSKLLLAKLRKQGVDLSGIEDKLLCIEDVVAGCGLWPKLRAKLRSRLNWRPLDRAAKRTLPTAAILFTSGSENLPKAVPLTHTNLAANVDAVQHVLTDLDADDVLLSALPPFHSFGLTVGVVLPACIGLRVAYHPSPTDGGILGEIIHEYRASLLTSTPTFFNGIVRRSNPHQLSPLRMVVVGAEKCPDRLFDTLETYCPQVELLEGYGTTECSPIVSVNPRGKVRRGTIGLPMQNLHVALVNEEHTARVAPGGEGLLLLRGPSIFGGYLGDAPTPFVSFEGELWYNTGDIVSEDSDGYLTFRGRRKRFIKRGGEMISLPAIEAILTEQYPAGDNGPVLAIEAAGGDESPEIVLLTTDESLTKEIANTLLREAGMGNLSAVRRVRQLDSIPLLGTGKTNYRALKEILAHA
ncbi:MAG: AMP-binding protein [Phycisphaerales bacterium]|jgi:acyl-[acyl-carrier-protein]-phospholipid O-acyltransferase / long-chain-fatty-acid--[acyl-carrier-protein] ligase|nr:AMP-binding protein [Phycisphaerales bacterium]MBT7096461.1 AMP-binding protein [Candidatus Poribacteria bacterium]